MNARPWWFSMIFAAGVALKVCVVAWKTDRTISCKIWSVSKSSTTKPICFAWVRSMWRPWLLKRPCADKVDAILPALAPPSFFPANMYFASQSLVSVMDKVSAFLHSMSSAGPYWLKIGSHDASFFGSWHSRLAFKKEAPAEERARLFFNETDRKMYTLACYKRLRDLERAGLVRAHSYLNHRKIFGLAERGHRLLLERGRAKLLGFRRGISEALLTHELAVNAVGLLIEQLLGLRARSEHERRVRSADPQAKGKPQRMIIPDLWIPDDKHPKPVEVELTQKSEFRYKELWRGYGERCPYGSQLLYLVGWPGGVKALLKLTGKLEKSGGALINVASLKAFQESLGRCAFVNRSYYWPRTVFLARPTPAAPPPAIASPAAILAAQEASR